MNHIEFVSALPKGLEEKRLEKALKLLAKHERYKKGFCVGLAFIPPKEMKLLNRSYRGKQSATDVLSFAPNASILAKDTKKQTGTDLGDIFICPSYARREARRRGIEANEEFVRLFVHGVLHLRDYDHMSEEEESRMFRIQERIIEETLK